MRDVILTVMIWATAALVLAVFVAVMVSENPEWAFELFGESEKFEILKFLGVGMGGVLLALQVWMSHRRAKAMEDAASAQSEATNQHARANQNTEQGQRQERLKNAIEHLGHRSVSVRLGGAYELLHLAQDTEYLRQTVHDILCAHIRETTTEGEYLERHPSEPSTEIQNLLTLLFVRRNEVFRGCEAHLEGSCLKGANLRGARLRGAVLTQAHLQFAILRDARLQGAFLRAARLLAANLCDAQLQGATLHNAKLQGADMKNAGLQGASLGGVDAQLQGATLHNAKLQGADMKNAGLQGASLGGVELQAADLQGVQLQGVKFWTEDNRASFPTFRELIKESIGRESDLSGGTFEDGVDQEGIDSLVEGLSDKDATWLREKLAPHIDKPYRRPQLPVGSGAITGTYTEEEAATWIAEYEADM